jgi:phosphoribosylformimino-5-aminoimidazole carboxamide ribotide isomerase
MILFPAIDLKDGKIVRLRQGDYQKVTRYDKTPLEQARLWAAAGAHWLHMVDLDAAKSGRPEHKKIIAEVAQKSGLKVQVGGGIRNPEMARAYLDEGVSRVVVGTQAVKDPEFLRGLGEKFPGRVALGLDTRDGKIAVQGWTETTETSVADYLAHAPLQGVACLIFTDIGRDGMLKGPNLPALKSVLKICPVPVIASGGVGSLQDLEAIAKLKDEKILGVIVGKALYEEKFTVEEALKITD